MTHILGAHHTALIDCCSLLNLYASRRLPEILGALPVRCAVAELAAAEALYVLRGGDGDDAGEHEPVDLEPLYAAGLLKVWPLRTDAEYAAYVAFAAELHDGEAATCALATLYGAAIITDERKTRRVLAARASAVAVVTTSQVMAHWATTARCEPPALRAALLDVQTRGRFRPGRQDPLRTWWENALGP